MTNRTNVTKMIIGLAAGLLAGVLSVAPVQADQPSSQRSGSMAERMTRETVVVTGIDRGARTATLQTAEGERRTVNVPPEVRSFDTLKVGDRIDIEYHEAMAISILPPGSKPSMSEKTTGARTGEGEGKLGRETTVSAEIVSIDTAANKVTFKGPKGQTRTVTVSDPAMQRKLPTLKPGQVVQFTYTEAVAASIRPTPRPSK